MVALPVQKKHIAVLAALAAFYTSVPRIPDIVHESSLKKLYFA
jgi:hypothetical protein